jgi:hypothetical protein
MSEKRRECSIHQKPEDSRTKRNLPIRRVRNNTILGVRGRQVHLNCSTQGMQPPSHSFSSRRTFLRAHLAVRSGHPICSRRTAQPPAAQRVESPGAEESITDGRGSSHSVLLQVLVARVIDGELAGGEGFHLEELAVFVAAGDQVGDQRVARVTVGSGGQAVVELPQFV